MCVLAAAVAVALGISGRDDNGAVSSGASKALPEARAANRPTILFSSLAHRGQVVIAPAARPDQQTLTALHCDR
ncbi:MAG: hypothetical protein ACXVFM_07750, partial [Solirubrobacteraceae bacterium]